MELEDLGVLSCDFQSELVGLRAGGKELGSVVSWVPGAGRVDDAYGVETVVGVAHKFVVWKRTLLDFTLLKVNAYHYSRLKRTRALKLSEVDRANTQRHQSRSKSEIERKMFLVAEMKVQRASMAGAWKSGRTCMLEARIELNADSVQM